MRAHMATLGDEIMPREFYSERFRIEFDARGKVKVSSSTSTTDAADSSELIVTVRNRDRAYLSGRMDSCRDGRTS